MCLQLGNGVNLVFILDSTGIEIGVVLKRFAASALTHFLSLRLRGSFDGLITSDKISAGPRLPSGFLTGDPEAVVVGCVSWTLSSQDQNNPNQKLKGDCMSVCCLSWRTVVALISAAYLG